MREPNLPDRLVTVFKSLSRGSKVPFYHTHFSNIYLFVSIHFYFRVFSTFPSKHLTSESKRNLSKYVRNVYNELKPKVLNKSKSIVGITELISNVMGRF